MTSELQKMVLVGRIFFVVIPPSSSRPWDWAIFFWYQRKPQFRHFPQFLAPSTVRPLARAPRVLVGWPLPLGFGLDGRLLLARRGRDYVQFIIISHFP